jgi:predicted HTH domain antitoxin
MSLVISDELLKASGLKEDELFLEIVLLLFQQEKLSLGKAAELLEMSQIRFQRLILIAASASITMWLNFRKMWHI